MKRILGAALIVLAVLALNVGVMIAPAQAATDTPCTDQWEDCTGSEEWCDGQWCGCMYGKYGYEC